MHRQDFYYDLPEALIAQYPAARRDAARLLTLDGRTGAFADHLITDLPALLQPGDLLVLNNTRVIPARLFARKPTGGRVEIMVERITGEREIVAQLRASKANRPGSRILVDDDIAFEIGERLGDLYRLRLHGRMTLTEVLQRHGHMPLPHYIRRIDESVDRDRYQTVYAQEPGAVAAPTAGLHFTDAMLAALQAAGIELAYITLHVGLGTFSPVRVDDLAEHRMHRELMQVDAGVCDAVIQARARGGRVVAVGTTSVRSLETAAAGGTLQPFQGETDIFIYPGYRFRVVDALLTNFHLPESTLLMLVCAFAGRENVLRAYAHAVAERYRFFSYGDAMFLTAADASPEENSGI